MTTAKLGRLVRIAFATREPDMPGMRFHIPFLLTCLLALPSLASPAGPDVLDGRSAVIIDGDTVAFGTERVRIINIEAPGISEPDCEREEIFALRSRQRLAELVSAGPVRIERTGRDQLGRTLGRLFLEDGRDVAEILVHEGLAVTWYEGSEARESRRRHWCG